MNTEAIIAEIQARPAIWKSSDPRHKLRNIVKKSWEEIKKQLPGVEVDDLKKKWKNLKDTYRKEIKKLPKTKSRAPTTDFESSWKYFTLLEFLRDEFMTESGESNLDEGQNEDAESSENEERYVEEFSSEVTTPSSPPLLNEPSTFGSPNQSKKRQNINDVRTEYLEIEKKKLKLLEKEMTKQDQNRTTERKSDDYHFLMSILPEMEKLPPVQKMRLRNKINQALLDEMTSNLNGEPNGR